MTLTLAFVLTGLVANAEDDDNASSSDDARPVPTTLERLRSIVPIRTKAPESNPLRDRVMYQNATVTDAIKQRVEERAEIRKEKIEDAKDIRAERREEAKLATTTAARREAMMKTRMDVFKVRQNALVRQLNLSISNLEQIAGRIEARIAKAEESGRDMTQAKRLLEVANGKINLAKDAMQQVLNYVPSTVATTTSSGSGDVELEKPRKIGADAIEAVKDARKALADVVRAIAHAMGLGNNIKVNTSTSTGTTTGSQ